MPHLALAKDPHDRLGARRRDAEFLSHLWAKPGSRYLEIRGNHFEVAAGAPLWRSTRETFDMAPHEPSERILLGESHGVASWAVLSALPPGVAASDDPWTRDQAPQGWATLRGVLLQLAASDTPDSALLLHAIGVAEWRRVTTFCPRCAGTLQPAAAGHELVCSECGTCQFPRTDPAVIMAISHGEPGTPQERLLLGRQAAWPVGRFSTLAGFCEPGESLEHAVRREVREEVGVEVGEVTYFGNQPWPLPASLMLGFTGRAVSTEITIDDDEICEARWVSREELPGLATLGEVMLPTGVSISRSLIESWFGGPLPGSW